MKKPGTKVIVKGLDQYRGMKGTLVRRTPTNWFNLSNPGRMFEVRLADGSVITTSNVAKEK